jgi:Fe-S oxidoreductase
MKTFLDWSAYDTYGIGDAYSGIPATGGNYAKAVAVCMHSRDCQNTGRGVMCPSYRITGDRKHSTEARVAAFKAALNDASDAQAFADPRLDEAMDLCVSCKACKKECPSSVDMTLIKTEYLAQRHEIKGVPARTRLFAGLPEWAGRYRAFLRFIIALRNRSKIAAKIAESWLGVTAARPLPEMAPKPFRRLREQRWG